MHTKAGKFLAREKRAAKTVVFVTILTFFVGEITAGTTTANALVFPEHSQTTPGVVSLGGMTASWSSTGRTLSASALSTTTINLRMTYPSLSQCRAATTGNAETFTVRLMSPNGNELDAATIASPPAGYSNAVNLSFLNAALFRDNPLEDSAIVLDYECRYNLMDGYGYRYHRYSTTALIDFAAPDHKISGLTLRRSNNGTQKVIIFTWDDIAAINSAFDGRDTTFKYRYSTRNAPSRFGAWKSTLMPFTRGNFPKNSLYAFQIFAETPYGRTQIVTLRFRT